MLSLEYFLPCYHSPSFCLVLGVYNKANIPCHLLFNIEIIHPRFGNIQLNFAQLNIFKLLLTIDFIHSNNKD